MDEVSGQELCEDLAQNGVRESGTVFIDSAEGNRGLVAVDPGFLALCMAKG